MENQKIREYGNIFSNSNILRIFISQIISTLCDKMMSIGLIWYLTENFSANIVPWFLAISFFPHLFMSYFSSKIISKFGMIKTIVSTEYLRAVTLFVLFTLLSLVELHSNGFLVMLFGAVFFIGVFSSVFNPAILSLPPKLVSPSDVEKVNGLFDMVFSISNILGAASSIILLNYFEIKWLILINSLSYLVAGFIQTSVKIKNNDILCSDQESEFSTSHFKILNKFPLIKKMLLSFMFINIIFTPILVIIPWYVGNIYKGDSSDLAILEGAMGVGAFLAGVLFSFDVIKFKATNRVKIISIICFLFGVMFQLFSFTRSSFEAILILYMIGSLSTVINIQILTYFQTELSSVEVPVVMSVVNIISAATMPLSFSISAILFPIVDIPRFALACGVITTAIAVFMPFYLSDAKVIRGDYYD